MPIKGRIKILFLAQIKILIMCYLCIQYFLYANKLLFLNTNILFCYVQICVYRNNTSLSIKIAFLRK